MNFSDIIKKSVLEGFNYSDFSTTKILITLLITFAIAIYIFTVYRLITRRTFYNKDFNVSMAVISIVTAGIVIAMQSNLVISLGMVGALSIVRFRTAVKDPMDLLFLFWSIAVGIVCGAGMYELAVLSSLVITVAFFVLQAFPVTKSPFLLIIKADKDYGQEEVFAALSKYAKGYKIDSKCITQNGVNLIIELRTKSAERLLDDVSGFKGIRSATFMHHEGELKN